MLTRKQHELLLYIDARLSESGVSPSFEEMKEALDLKSKSGVHRLISALVERGFIRRLPNRARALEVLKVPEADRAVGALFVNFDAGDGWLDTLADGDKEAAANLAPLDALGMSSWRDGDVQHGLVRLKTD